MGLEHYQEANDQFRALVKQNPKNADYRVRWGRLFLERFNPTKRTACSRRPWRSTTRTRRPTSAWRSGDRGFQQAAVEFAQKAAELDPKLCRSARTARLIWRSKTTTKKPPPSKPTRRWPSRPRRWTRWRSSRHRLVCTTRTTRPGSIAFSRSIRRTARPTPPPAIFRHQSPLRRRHRAYRKALELNPALVGSARAAGRQSHALGPGRRGPPATRSNATTPTTRATRP